MILFGESATDFLRFFFQQVYRTRRMLLMTLMQTIEALTPQLNALHAPTNYAIIHSNNYSQQRPHQFQVFSRDLKQYLFLIKQLNMTIYV